MAIKLAYGLKNDEMVKVTEVANGLACDCICLDCKKRLVAVNKVKKQTAHFRHYKQKEDCQASQETTIHYLAKEIIERNKKLIIPAYYVKNKYKMQNAKTVIFDKIDNENKINTSQGYKNIKPDLIGYYKEQSLFIEISVSHPSDVDKIEKLKALNISAIEIDLSKFDRHKDEQELEKYLAIAPIKWLYHIKHEEFYKAAVELEELEAKRKKEYEQFIHEQEIRSFNDKLKRNFSTYFKNQILYYYKGDLFTRIIDYIKSEYRNSIIFKNQIEIFEKYIEHNIEGLENYINVFYKSKEENGVFIETHVQVEVDFMGLSISASCETEKYIKFGKTCAVIASIFYEASKILCPSLENQVKNAEINTKINAEKERRAEIKYLIRKFKNAFPCDILNNYNGNFIDRIEKFVDSNYKSQPDAEKLEDGIKKIVCTKYDWDDCVLIVNDNTPLLVKTEFMGIKTEIKYEPKSSQKETINVILVKIYFSASKKLCSYLEKKVLIQEEENKLAELQAEIERKQLEKENEEKREEKRKALEKEQKEARNKREQEKMEYQQKQEARKKQIESLFSSAVKNLLLKRKKLSSKNPIKSQEVISAIKQKLPDLNEREFIDARRSLQKKGLLKPVEENKLLTANFIASVFY